MTRQEYTVNETPLIHSDRTMEAKRSVVDRVCKLHCLRGGGWRTSPFLRFFAYASGLHPIRRGK